jgi:membrane protein implicated in regulation of membrane protease activity
MQQFLENNWLSILSIVIGVVVAYVFYRLQKKDSASASAERLKHATIELLDVIESYIINKQRLSEQVIDNLIHASERDHKVALRPACTAISLLQDVALRLQRSRHLDIPQKSEYSEKIEQLILAIREHRTPARLEDLGGEIANKLGELESLLPQDRRGEVQEILGAIARMAQKQRDMSLRTEEARQRLLAVTTALSGVAAAVATSLIGSKLFDSISGSAITSVFSKTFPLMGVLLAVVVVMQALTTVRRIKRRSSEGFERNRSTDGSIGQTPVRQ